MIEACSSNLVEVTFSDERIPVISKAGKGLVFTERLGVGPFAPGCLAVGPFLEDGGCNPWLEDKPTP